MESWAKKRSRGRRRRRKNEELKEISVHKKSNDFNREAQLFKRNNSNNYLLLLILIFYFLTNAESHLELDYEKQQEQQPLQLSNSNNNNNSNRIDLMPKAARCLIRKDNMTNNIKLAKESFNNFIQSTQNTVQLLMSTTNINNFTNSNNNNQIKYQKAFESICNGWRNSLDSLSTTFDNKDNNGFSSNLINNKPTAFWVYDEFRGALVAKFIYYDKSEFVDLSSRDAKLISPIFNPIPIYHSMQDSKYYSSCKIKFKTYMTISAHLQLTLILVPTSTSTLSSSSSTSSTSLNNQQQSNKIILNQQEQPYTIATILGDRIKTINNYANEKSFWLDHIYTMPFNLSLNSLYLLEFSAIPSTITSNSKKQTNYLNGIAIANFSLSPQCFGQEVEQEELDRIKQLIGRDPIIRPASNFNYENDYIDNNNNNDEIYNNYDNNILKLAYNKTIRFFNYYKIILITITIILILIFILLHIYFYYKHYRRKYSRSNSTNALPGNKHYLPKPAQNIFFKLFCCCLDDIRRHRRIYDKNNNNNQFKNKTKSSTSTSIETNQYNRKYPAYSNGNLNNNNNNPYTLDGIIDEFNDLTTFTTGAIATTNNNNNNYLRPLRNMFENVELNYQNPNYLADGSLILNNNQQQQLNFAHQHNNQFNNRNNLFIKQQYKKYHINRKRLTLTDPIGEGAFGIVYQGYLICSNQNQNLNNVCNENNNQRLSSTSSQIVNGNNNDFDEFDSETHSIKVAVKTLTKDEKDQSKEDFIEEAKNMSLVDHRNIVKLIGICFDEKPFYIVMELLPGGNLKNFLIKNRDKQYNNSKSSSSSLLNIQQQQQATSINNNNKVKLCMGDLLVFALDIARACDYLQKRQFIHRDLAARNCLLTSNIKSIAQFNSTSTTPISMMVNQNNNNYQCKNNNYYENQNNNNNNNFRSFLGSPPSAMEVDAQHKVDLESVFLNGYQNSSIVAKLADFGMTRDVCNKNYYRLVHKTMPVRWMPPESLDGVATTKSDVWSFGIFLWELFSMGEQPYYHLPDNEQVINFIRSRRHAKLKKPKTNKRTSKLKQQQLEQEQAQQQQPPPSASTLKSFGVNDQQELLLSVSNKLDDNVIINDDEQVFKDDDVDDDDDDSLDEADMPPLRPPHLNTPMPIYSIMCSCWATNPEERPQFEEIANRLYWCLRMPDVLNTSLPCFYEQQQQQHQQQQQQLPLNESRQINLNTTQTSQLNWY